MRARQRGRRVRVAWHNAPGYRRDWIGIWKRGDNDLYNDYLSFAYTEASVAGSTTFSGLTPGRYVARLMKDDGYAELAQASFTVAHVELERVDLRLPVRAGLQRPGGADAVAELRVALRPQVDRDVDRR